MQNKTCIQEGRLLFEFPDGWDVSKYDQWSFYKNRFKDCCNGNKGVDFLACSSDNCLWLIEVKDYRSDRRTKEIYLWDEVALKTRDTLAGLVAAKMATDHSEHSLAQKSLMTEKIRVVLHLEQPATHSKLFPRVFDLSKVRQKLRQILKPIDAHPIVTDLQNPNMVCWSVSSVS
ncbi:MAG TPA: hypothetical protein PLM07_19735 [Candidatus Rifleibacterium sp.]|nr:hypothetical protein [Candidatus Rifleibacterium sp.]HPT48120.1 hypothetical protein [Candidatus Rifleibacterium sp.]